jgi:hypothetical protein
VVTLAAQVRMGLRRHKQRPESPLFVSRVRQSYENLILFFLCLQLQAYRQLFFNLVPLTRSKLL